MISYDAQYSKARFMIRTYQRFLSWVLAIIDCTSLIAALPLAYLIRFHPLVLTSNQPHMNFSGHLQGLFILLPLMLATYAAHGLYSSFRVKRFSEEFGAVLRSNILIGVALLGVLFLINAISYSRGVILILIILNTFFVLSLRLGIRSMRQRFYRRGQNMIDALVIGAGDTGREFAQKVAFNPQFGYRIVGFIDDFLPGPVLTKSILGTTADLETVFGKHMIDEVIIALPLRAYDKMAHLVNLCEKHGVKAQIIPAYQKMLPARPAVDNFDGIPLINIRHIPLDEPLARVTKRTFDILFSLCALIALSPVLITAAAAVMLSSPGPIIFKQERIGRHRRPFHMYKFRSMRVDGDAVAKTTWTTADDPRKTKVGTFLRKTSIDELPQFVNVLLGDMSVIGPRPERPHFVEQFKEEIPRYMVKHHVLPGITGWAQIHGWRGDTSIEKRIECDIWYIENWTFGLDMYIAYHTVLKGFVNKNAY